MEAAGWQAWHRRRILQCCQRPAICCKKTWDVERLAGGNYSDGLTISEKLFLFCRPAVHQPLHHVAARLVPQGKGFTGCLIFTLVQFTHHARIGKRFRADVVAQAHAGVELRLGQFDLHRITHCLFVGLDLVREFGADFAVRHHVAHLNLLPRLIAQRVAGKADADGRDPDTIAVCLMAFAFEFFQQFEAIIIYFQVFVHFISFQKQKWQRHPCRHHQINYCLKISFCISTKSILPTSDYFAPYNARYARTAASCRAAQSWYCTTVCAAHCSTALPLVSAISANGSHGCAICAGISGSLKLLAAPDGLVEVVQAVSVKAIAVVNIARRLGDSFQFFTVRPFVLDGLGLQGGIAGGQGTQFVFLFRPQRFFPLRRLFFAFQPRQFVLGIRRIVAALIGRIDGIAFQPDKGRNGSGHQVIFHRYHFLFPCF
nr:MAG TPA: hypothetical protein [Caudoviricetes sp.]